MQDPIIVPETNNKNIWEITKELVNLSKADNVPRQHERNGVTIVAYPNSRSSDLSDLYTARKLINRYKARFGDLP